MLSYRYNFILAKKTVIVLSFVEINAIFTYKKTKYTDK